MANIHSSGGRPAGRRNATDEEKEQFFYLVDVEKLTPEEAAESLGFQPATGRNWVKHRGAERPSGERTGARRWASKPPVAFDDLPADLKACLQFTPEGFNLFRARFLDTFEVAWQTEAAAMLIQAEIEAAERDSNAPIRMLGNVFPGGGKSKMFTHDYPVWRIVVARAHGQDIRIQLGARTLTQSEMYTLRVRNSLTRRQLVQAFGRFKEQHPILWEKSQFLIEHLPGVYHDEKEPTIFAVSQQSGFLGARAHIAIWDDLVDKANNRTAEARELLRHWWNDEAASRVEPRGVLLLVGTRTGPNDLFATLSKLGIDTGEQDGQGRPVSRRLYRHYVFPLHATDRCTGGKSRAAADHVDCLNYPERYNWEAVLDLMVASAGRFRLTYQQEDQDLDVAFVQIAWVEGTEDDDGISHPGCLDYARGLWEALPRHNLEEYRAMIAVDPSPTQWWAVQSWVFDRKHDLDLLVGMDRRRMSADQLLDLAPGTFNYSGLLEEFVKQTRALGIKLNMLVIEANAAQKFLTQYAFFKDWARSRSILIRPHQTHGPGLLDPKYGIWSMSNRWKHGKVRLPWKNPVTRRIVGQLINEAYAYPEGETDDTLMAQWFGHANRDRLGLADKGPEHYTPDSALSPWLAATRHGGAWEDVSTSVYSRS